MVAALSEGTWADAGGIATGGDVLKPPGFVNMLGHVGCEGTMSIGSVG